MNEIDMIAYKFMLTAGILMCIFGTIGNILNIYIFTKWSYSRDYRNQRTSNSPLYLLTSSIANLIIITYPLITRILFDGSQYQVTENHVFLLCKLRYYVLHTFDLISLTCLCMATFDRYLISSREARLRQLNTTRRGTKLIILFIILLNFFHSIPLGIYYTISNAGQCIINSSIYLYYYLYVFQIILHSIIPIIFLTIVGILTYKQLKTLKIRINQNRNLDKQISRMLLLMSIAIILSSIPYCIEQFYYVMTYYGNSQLSSTFYFCHIIASILFYTNPVYSFYVYYVSTPNFRIQIQRLITCKKSPPNLAHNQIHTIHIQHNTK